MYRRARCRRLRCGACAAPAWPTAAPPRPRVRATLRRRRGAATARGSSAKAMAPWVMAVRVVSLPANTSTWKKLRYSDADSRSPSSSAWTSWVTRSSRGSTRRSAPIRSPYSYRAWLAGAGEREQAQLGGVAVGVGRQRRTIAGALDEVVGELDEEVGVLHGHTQDRQDHPDGQRRGDVFDPVAAAALDEVVEQLAGDGPGEVLPAADVARRERLGHQAPQPGVIGRVGVDDGAAGLERIGLEVPQVRVPDARREQLGCSTPCARRRTG
jgi:hypothetical protein